MSKEHSNNTDNNKTDISKTDLSFVPRRKSNGMKKIKKYEDYFRSQLDYDVLLKNNFYDRETIEAILNLLVETCAVSRQTIPIAGDDKPADVVRSRLMKLDSSHIGYVFDCLKENTTAIRDMKQYLLAVLYNAPLTIDAYYTPCMLCLGGGDE